MTSNPEHRIQKATPEQACEWSVTLPWPDRRLHPNFRGHWTRKAGATSNAREWGYLCGLHAGLKRANLPKDAKLDVTAVFAPPDNRRRDTDGMLSSCKAYLDGISDVAGVDDSRWTLHIRREEPVKHGQVRIELRRVDA